MTQVPQPTNHPHISISAYADGELTVQEEEQVEAHLAHCTECARELALIRSMGEAMTYGIRSEPPPRSIWERVHRRITQPIGWILAVAGIAIWATLGIIEWFRAGALTLPWLATTAIGIGIALILVAIGYEQYREWRHSPYKDVER
jgi:anti-sigma factor RsiW